MFYRTLIISLMLMLGTNLFAQQKRALLIGIGAYTKESGWKRLSSANDIRYLQQVLQVKGFAQQNIHVLLDSMATYDGIAAAVEKLISETKTGDVVMLHFSGHGQQITDLDGDEADGYDEAWVAWDAMARYDNVQYRGAKHVRDDLIGTWVNALATAVGSNGSVLITIDACHSGTATRAQDLAVARGVPVPFRIPVAQKESYRPGGNTASDFLSTSNIEKGNVVVYSASSPTQVNYETTDAGNSGVGSLSYGFAQALAAMPEGATYSDLFYRIKARIQSTIPAQLPMMEGNGKQQLFSGNYTAGIDKVLIDRWISDTSFTFKMGSLHQLASGAELAIIDDAANVQVGKAVASTVSVVESVGTVRAPLDKSKTYIIKILSMPAAPYTITVGYDKASLPKGWQPMLEKGFANMRFVSQGENADAWISYIADTGLAIITRNNGIAYLDGSTKNGKLTAEDITQLSQPLQDIAKANYMRSLPDGGPLSDMVVWEVTAKDGRKATENELEFEKGAYFDLRLKNNSKQAIYFALINILPDGTIEVLLPDAESTPEEFNVQPGESFVVKDNMIPENAKAGREFLRVMVSHVAFDIRPVFNKTAPKRSGNLTSWEQAMRGIMQDESIGMAQRRSVSVNEISILTQSFQVKAK